MRLPKCAYVTFKTTANGLKIHVARSRHIISVEHARISRMLCDVSGIVKGKMGGRCYLDFAREHVGHED